MYDKLFSPLHNVLSKIFISITGLEKNDSRVTFIINMILGQITNIIVHKDMILKSLNIKVFDTNSIEELKRIFVNHTRAILNMYK